MAITIIKQLFLSLRLELAQLLLTDLFYTKYWGETALQRETVYCLSPNLLSPASSLSQLYDVPAKVAETVHQLLLTCSIADTVKVIFNLARTSKAKLVSFKLVVNW